MQILSSIHPNHDHPLPFHHVDDYYNFIGEAPESPYRKELDVLFRRAQKALGQYSGTDDELKEKEKDFERERKKLMKQSLEAQE